MEVDRDSARHTFAPRDNASGLGRILIAYGRGAADVPLILTFGANTLTRFVVKTGRSPSQSPDARVPFPVPRGAPFLQKAEPS